MTASLAELVVEGGATALRCPVSGIPVFTEDSGFESDDEHSPHLRFFVDWIGQVWAVEPQVLPSDQADYQKKIVEIFEQSEEDEDNQSALVAKCLQVLPDSVLVVELLDPRPVPSMGPYATRVLTSTLQQILAKFV